MISHYTVGRGPARSHEVESRYAPFFIGTTNPAGGLFPLDSNVARCGWRASVPNAVTASKLWIYASIAGAAVNETLRVRVCKGLTADKFQPDLVTAGTTIQWTLPGVTAVGWISIDINSLGLRFDIGDVIHVVLERQAGTLTGSRKISFPSAGSRYPVQYTYRVNPRGAAFRDEYSAMMYSTNNTAPLTNPYVAQKDNNRSFHPIWFIEASSGDSFGNPYDILEDKLCYGAGVGAHSWTMSVLMADAMALNYMAITVRGSGPSAALGAPGDDLLLQIKDDGGTIVYGPAVFVNATVAPIDKMFQGRPHWYGHELSVPTVLAAGRRYEFQFFAPGASASTVNDSYTITVFESSLSALVWTNQNGIDSYAINNGSTYSPRAIFGFMLRQIQAGTPFALIDEFSTRVNAGSTTELKAASGDTVLVTPGISRNINALSDGITGGEIFARLRNADTGLPPPIYTGDIIISGPSSGVSPVVVSMKKNDENIASSWSLGFTMPGTDIHLRIETGHALVPGTLAVVGGIISDSRIVVDDWSPLEISNSNPISPISGALVTSESAGITPELPIGVDLAGAELFVVVLSTDGGLGDPAVLYEDDANFSLVDELQVASCRFSLWKGHYDDLVGDSIGSFTTATAGLAARLFAVLNPIQTGDRVAAHGTITSNAASDTVDLGSVTPDVPGCACISLMASFNAAGVLTAGAVTGTGPVKIEVFDSGATVAALSLDLAIAMSFGIQVAPAATGARTSTLSSAADVNFGMQLAVRPG